MIDIGGAIPNILTRLKKLDVGHGLELLTFKKDRGLRICKTDSNTFATTEFGFQNENSQTDLKGMKKLLKTVLKREFPRSNKIRVSALRCD